MNIYIALTVVNVLYHLDFLIFTKPYEIHSVVSILQVRKLRHRKVTHFVKGHTTSE